MNKMTRIPALGALEDGIYFDLPFEEYLAERRFSFHLGKDALISPLTCWANHIDPTREDKDTTATKLGRAFHARVLEGEAVFKELFAIKPENDGEYLDGGDELRARCAELDLKKSGSIAEMCARILEKDPDAKLWHVVMEAWKEENKGKDVLTAEQWRNIEVPARTIHAHPEMENAFRGGYPEVSIMYTDPESGVQCKNRIDYLKVKSIIELKTFSNQSGLPISKAIARTLTGRKYHMQARMELAAVDHARRFAAKGRVMGDVDPEWLKAFTETAEHKLIWVFVQQGRVPEIRIRRFERYVAGASEGATENLLWTHGWDCAQLAMRTYRECLEFYSDDPSVPWISPEPMRAFADEEFGAWSFE